MGDPAKARNKRARDAWYEGSGKTFSTDGREPRPHPIGLTFRDADDLRFLFREYAGLIGMRSNFSSMQAPLEGVRGTNTSPESYDQLAGAVNSITRSKRAYRILVRMIERGDSRYVTVLHLVYGEPHPNAHDAVFGKELAPLASMTEASEVAREELATREGERRSLRTVEACRVSTRSHRSRAELDRKKAARRVELIREELAFLDEQRSERSAPMSPEQQQAENIHEEALREELAARESALTDATNSEVAWSGEPINELRASLTALAQADREVTTEEALRYRLEYHGKRDPKGKPEKSSHEAWNASRREFVARVSSEARQLLIAACGAFRAASEALRGER